MLCVTHCVAACQQPRKGVGRQAEENVRRRVRTGADLARLCREAGAADQLSARRSPAEMQMEQAKAQHIGSLAARDSASAAFYFEILPCPSRLYS